MVGSGQQVTEVLDRALTTLIPGLPLLFVPLVISAVGLARLTKLFAANRRCAIRPTLVVPKALHVRPRPTPNEPEFIAKTRAVIQRTASRIGSHAFGFDDLGTLVVPYTNCPNNAPALIWREQDDWAALFPRVSRKGRRKRR